MTHAHPRPVRFPFPRPSKSHGKAAPTWLSALVGLLALGTIWALLVLNAGAASASDGAREINQNCLGTCTLILDPGSYVLTSDLVLSATSNAIFVAADDVTIDLNGFTVRGPTTCSGATGSDLVCTPTSSGEAHGVRAAGENVVVKNGRIRGMPNYGILCGDGCRVENVELVENGRGGASVGDGSLVRDCIVRRNGGIGVGFGGSGGSRYVDNVFLENAGSGLSTASHSVVTGNAAYRNGGTGLFTNPGSVVIGNVSASNGGDGIRAFRGLVRENTVQDNALTGLNLGVSDSLYSDNVIDGNGATVTSGTQSGVNWCNTNTTCP